MATSSTKIVPFSGQTALKPMIRQIGKMTLAPRTNVSTRRHIEKLIMDIHNDMDEMFSRFRISSASLEIIDMECYIDEVTQESVCT